MYWLALAYVAVGLWPAIATWFAHPDIHPLIRFVGLLFCVALWPLALIKGPAGR